jgi:DnaJ-class molecular chaperone
MQQDRKLKTLEAKAFDTLGLSSTAKQEDIKRRYKELVKKHHPMLMVAIVVRKNVFGLLFKHINC